MDVYQISVDLKPGVSDQHFVAALDGYLSHLKSAGKIKSVGASCVGSSASAFRPSANSRS